jgi:hypothetical protein
LPNGQNLNVEFYIYESIKLGGVVLPQIKFYLLDMSPGVILGMQFLHSRSATVDFASRLLTIRYAGKEAHVFGISSPTTSFGLDHDVLNHISTL